MYLTSINLSTFESPKLSCSLIGVDVKQVRRVYPGGYKTTSPLCFQNFTDSKTIHYSNFYLTDEYLFSDIFNTSENNLRSDTILTKFKYGRQFLTFEDVNPEPFIGSETYDQYVNYGIGVFRDNKADDFFISFNGYGKCTMYYIKKDFKYYLVSDSDNKVFFVNESLLDFDNPSVSQPQDFNYVFQSDGNFFLLFKQTTDGSYVLRKNGDVLVLRKNIISYVYDPFKLSRDAYTKQNSAPNFNYVVYNNADNFINDSKTLKNLRSNFLVHKKIGDYNDNLNVINLKNHLVEDDTFSTANNMLSGGSETSTTYISSFREYTSICDEIYQQESDELKLNYVYYNKSYIIEPGKHTFVAPDNMYPFSQLNVNDTKFVYSGAFAFTSPKFADKIYRVDDDTTLRKDGQHLLCTWLSGNPNSDTAIWVDRYYYPDLIEKEEALQLKSFSDRTYDEYLEDLLQNNIDIKNEIKNLKILDKTSDLYFEPNKTYIYDRFKPEVVGISEPDIPCSVLQKLYPDNYFKEINQSGKMTVTFDIAGVTDNWVVESDTNSIKSRLQIRKTGLDLDFSYAIFNPVTEKLESYSTKAKLKGLKKNIFSFSLDAISGDAYVFLNNQIIYEFNISPFKFVRWQVLYGDIFIIVNQIKENLPQYQGRLIDNIQIDNKYTPKDEAYLLPIQRGILEVNDITITLPCGMRNDIDQIDILQDICNSSTYASDHVNVLVKNVDTEEINTDDLKEFLEENINEFTPVNTKVRSIKFKQFK